MNDRLISLNAAIDAMMKLQTEDIEAYGASIPEGFDGDRAVAVLKALPSAQPTDRNGQERTGTDRNGQERTGTDRNGLNQQTGGD